MSKVVLALSVLLLSQSLPAQSGPPSARSMGSCSSGLRGGGAECAPERRLLIVVTFNGSEPSALIQNVIGMAASAGGAFALTPQNATTSDSSFYAMMTVSRDAEGNYRMEQSIAGSAVKSPRNCRSSATGGLDDLGFGAFLALQTEQLVRCVQNARGAAGAELRQSRSQPSAPMNDIPVTLTSGTVIHVRNVVVLRSQDQSALTLYIQTPTAPSERDRVAAEAKEALNFQLKSTANDRFGMANVVVCRTQACLEMMETPREMFLFGRDKDGAWQLISPAESH